MNRFVLRRIVQLESQAREFEEQKCYESAVRLREEVCQLVGDHLGESHPWRTSRLLDLAASCRRADDTGRAEAVYRDMIRLVSERHGDDHLDVARGLNALGVLYCETRRHESAIGLFDRALSISREHLPPDDPGLAAVLNNMACAHHALGHHRQAESCYREALMIYEQRGTVASLEEADCRRDLAELAADEGRNEDCESLIKEALATYRVVLRDRDPSLAGVLVRLAHVYRRIGRSSPAITLLEEAVEIFQEAGATQECQLAQCLDQLSEMHPR